MNRAGKANFQLAIRFVCAVMLILVSLSERVMADGTCGTGTWTSGNLEIHHINIGQGDSTLIVGPTGKSLLFDVGEENWNSSAKAQVIGPYIEGVLGCKSLDYVVISHFHFDHVGYVGYGGLWSLVETQGFTVGTTILRDYNTYLGNTSGTLTNWKTYFEGVGQAKLNPVTAVEGTSQIDLGTGVTFNIVTHDGNGALIAGDFHGDASPPSENDYSIGVVLSYGAFDEWIGGDLDGKYDIGGFGYTYHDIELSVAPEVGDMDVYKVNHHASSHSSSATFVNQLDPEVSIVTVGDGNTYGHPAQSTMDTLLATSAVYMTERGDTNTDIGSAIVAGNIVIKTSDGSAYTVNGTDYTATEPPRIDTDGDGYFIEVDPADDNQDSIPSPNGGCSPNYQNCSVSCQVSTGQVLINEVLPAPSSGSEEWVELYNTTASTINIGYCYIDDIAAGSTAYQIPAATIIPSHGFWTLDRTTYFNNAGDEVRFLMEDGNTVLDVYSYGNTGSNLSWYRFLEGGNWASTPTASTTKGQPNNQSFISCTAQTQIPTAECNALVALYNRTNGASWVNKTGWLQTNAPCSWYGIGCANGRNVTELSLTSNNLTGAIPRELGQLTYLQILYLGVPRAISIDPEAHFTAIEFDSSDSLNNLQVTSNQLGGAIPPELGNLRNLQQLALSDNQLSGTIPPELGNLTNLNMLALDGNQLSGTIPPELGNLTNLEQLLLRFNQLSGAIPSELGNLVNLGILALSNNQLSGLIPPELGNLTSLQYLVLNNDKFSGAIPPELGNLVGLELLILSDNQLSESIPLELGNLTGLTRLYLHNNSLNGEIPLSITNLTSLTTFTFDCWMTSTNPSVIAFIEFFSPGWQSSICPVVLSITRDSPNPTGSSSIDFIVTFSESVTGVNTNDFILKTVGVFGGVVSGVSGSNNIYTITVNTGTGNKGTIRLDMPVNATVNDLDGNLLARLPFTNGDPYIVNKFIPKAPTLRSPRAAAIMNNAMPTFWWTNVKGGETYEIEFATNIDFTIGVENHVVNNSSYIVATPLIDGDYFWRVRAYNFSNQPGVWSSARAFTINTTEPIAPILSSPFDNSTSKHTPTFKWLGTPRAVLYEFQYDKDSNFSIPISYAVTTRGTFRRPPAMGSGIYYWHVRAKDAAGNWGAWSAPFTITITGP